jgi:hypothetical protein
MTVSTFKETRAEIFASGAVFGNTDHFGEMVTVRPAGGGPNRQVKVTVIAASREDQETEYHEEQQELIWVSVAKDESCARGGIGRAATGLAIVREGDVVSWSFQNRTRHETSYSWELLFGRIRPKSYGPNR